MIQKGFVCGICNISRKHVPKCLLSSYEHFSVPLRHDNFRGDCDPKTLSEPDKRTGCRTSRRLGDQRISPGEPEPTRWTEIISRFTMKSKHPRPKTGGKWRTPTGIPFAEAEPKMRKEVPVPQMRATLWLCRSAPKWQISKKMQATQTSNSPPFTNGG